MSSYLDFVIEKKDEDGKWKLSMKSSYDEDEAIVNPYILRDIFQFYLDIDNVIKFDDFETEIAMSEKFPEYYKDYKNYPYDKERILCPCTLGSYYENDLLDCLERIYKSKDAAHFSDIALRIKNHDWLNGKVTDFLNDKNIIHGKDDTYYYKFSTAYEAYNFVKYNLMPNGFDYKNIFDEVDFIAYKNADGKFMHQYIADNVKVSYNKDLCKVLKNLEKEYEDYKTSINDENWLRKLLNELLDEEDLKENTPLSKKIKAFMEGGNLNYYAQEEIEELTARIEEMKLLIRLVGENGRVVWKISC